VFIYATWGILKENELLLLTTIFGVEINPKSWQMYKWSSIHFLDILLESPEQIESSQNRS
jgi:hypothetical protein